MAAVPGHFAKSGTTSLAIPAGLSLTIFSTERHGHNAIEFLREHGESEEDISHLRFFDAKKLLEEGVYEEV